MGHRSGLPFSSVGFGTLATGTTVRPRWGTFGSRGRLFVRRLVDRSLCFTTNCTHLRGDPRLVSQTSPFVAIGLDPAGDADPTGTVSELSEPAARQSGEPDGGGAPDQLDEEREHDREEGHGEHKSKGEEAGAYIRHGDVRDETRRGARLILAFDPARSAFGGTVEKTT